jgi:type II secretory pathway pseudopilin PulG
MSGRRQYGFTLIELMIVIGIGILMMALAVPGVMRSLGRAGLNNATAAVVEAATAARVMARRQWSPPAGQPIARFGVVVVDPGADGRGWVAVTFGTTSPPTAADVLKSKTSPWKTWSEYLAAPDELDAAGQPIPVKRIDLASSIRFHAPAAATPLAEAPQSSVGWIYQARSGSIVNAVAVWATEIDMGVAPLLVARDATASMAAAVAIYSAGPCSIRVLR